MAPERRKTKLLLETQEAIWETSANLVSGGAIFEEFVGIDGGTRHYNCGKCGKLGRGECVDKGIAVNRSVKGCRSG